ncbi:hypothetical protein B0H13DRAFT_1918177 [Mycena leptocephala]|nr:hypothetical protein B0H13DRAFT_1918177 [Mycena leptocephala]
MPSQPVETPKNGTLCPSSSLLRVRTPQLLVKWLTDCTCISVPPLEHGLSWLRFYVAFFDAHSFWTSHVWLSFNRSPMEKNNHTSPRAVEVVRSDFKNGTGSSGSRASTIDTGAHIQKRTWVLAHQCGAYHKGPLYRRSVTSPQPPSTTMDTGGLSGVADARDIKISEKDFHDHVAQPGPPEGGDGKPTSFAEYIHWATLRRQVEATDSTVVHSKGFGLVFAKFGKEKEHGADVEVHEANESASDDLRGMSAHDVELLNARRALRQFSIVANASVWLNLLIIFTSMGFIANSPPNFAASAASYGTAVSYTGPIQVLSINPIPVFAQVNGVFNMVFAYGGAMIFPEMMAEMRRPRDFIKGMAIAQLLIFCCYLMYGIFVYCFQGQYTLALAYQGVSKYSWQSLDNALAMITGAIAAGLYSNIGFKIFYINIIEGLLGGPAFMTIKGRRFDSYWAIAFVIGTGVPAIGALSGLIAAVCIFQFTYTFPPLFMLGLDMQLDAMTEDEAFTTPGVTPKRIDTWRDLSRWKRGFFSGGLKRVAFKAANLLFFLVGVATAGLGMWATGTDLKEVIAAGAASSLGCAAPV